MKDFESMFADIGDIFGGFSGGEKRRRGEDNEDIAIKVDLDFS
jgi:hypothetical protein